MLIEIISNEKLNAEKVTTIDDSISSLVEGVKLFKLTRENLKLKNKLEKKHFQFGCFNCKKYFWKKVYVYKPVSRHHNCRLNSKIKFKKLSKNEGQFYLVVTN